MSMDPMRYQELFYNLHLPVLVFEREGTRFFLSDFNPVSQQSLGNVFNFTLNKDAEDVFPHFPDIARDLDHCLSSSKKQYRERFQAWKKNSENSDLLKLTFIKSPPKTVFVIIQDSKLQKQATRTLSMTKDRFELAIKAADSGIWDWNFMTGEIIFNDLWFTNLGYEPTELDHNLNTWEKLLHPDDKERVLDQLGKHLTGETNIYQTEHRLLCKDGEWKWVLDTGRVIKWQKNGQPLRVIGTKMEITKRKQLEEELELLNIQLEIRVKERTKRLYQKKQALLKTQEAVVEKSRHLEEVNSALKILIKKSSENKEDVEKNIASNINELVIPYLEKMNSSSSAQQKILVKIIRSNLEEVTASFSLKLTSQSLHLSPAELRVANMIKHGSSTKDIAELLLLSPRTIETQRRIIRKKLGLIGKDINLRTYLQHFK